MPPFVTSILGILAILGVAFLLSTGKRRISLRVVGAAFALQALMALLVLRTPFGVSAIQGLSNGVIALLDYSKVGIEAVFGSMDANPFANTFVIAALPSASTRLIPVIQPIAPPTQRTSRCMMPHW